MIGFIMAAGLSTRFAGFPKQLLVCDGETLLSRQARQFKEFCDPLYLVTHRKDLIEPKTTLLVPEERRIKATTLKSTMPKWNSSVVLVVHGDVYFTDAAKERIVERNGDRPAFFGRGNEMFAMWVPPEAHWIVASSLDSLIENTCPGACENEAGLSHLYEILKEVEAAPEFVLIDDPTQDFDTPRAHEGWQRGERHNP